MSDVFKVSISLLKSFETEFCTEKNNFDNKTYNTFLTSYLKNSSNLVVSKMSKELDTIYEKIKNGYDKIDEWWLNYNNDIEYVENYMAGNISGSSKDSSVLSAIHSLSELKKYNESEATFSSKSGSILSSLNKFGSKISSFLSDIGNDIKVAESKVTSTISSLSASVSEAWNSDGIKKIKIASETVENVVKKTSATVGVGVTSILEGIGEFGEAIVDFADIVGTINATVVTGAEDLALKGVSAITGTQYESRTKAMWEDTMAFVSTEHVKSLMDNFYDDTKLGQFISQNAYGYDTVRSVGSGIGYIAGVVALTVATFGVGGVVVAGGGTVTAAGAAAATSTTQMAAVAAAAGVGKGTEEAWANGANAGEGLLSGTLSGIWEGIQFYIGGKISGLNILNKTGTLNTAVNGLARIVLDGFDGGLDSFAYPLINSIYQDGYYDDNGNYTEFLDSDNIITRFQELFDDNGGWTSVLTNAAIGSGFSFIGEVGNFAKYFKQDSDAVVTTSNISGESRIMSSDIRENITTDESISVVSNTIDGNTHTVLTAVEENSHVSSTIDNSIEQLTNDIESLDYTDFRIVGKNTGIFHKLSDEKLVSGIYKTIEEQRTKLTSISKMLIEDIGSERFSKVFNMLSPEAQKELISSIDYTETISNLLKSGDISNDVYKKIVNLLDSFTLESNLTNIRKINSEITFSVDGITKTIKTADAIKMLNDYKSGFASLDQNALDKLFDGELFNGYNYKELNSIIVQLSDMIKNNDILPKDFLDYFYNISIKDNTEILKIMELPDIIIDTNNVSKTIKSYDVYKLLCDNSLFDSYCMIYTIVKGKNGYSAADLGRAILQFKNIINENKISLDFNINAHLRMNTAGLSERATEFVNWSDTSLIERLKNSLFKYVDDSKIESARGITRFLDEDIFESVRGNPRSMGFNNGKNSYLSLNNNDINLRSSATHESIHQLSAIEGASGVYRIEEERGLNETLTEFINEIVCGDDYPKTSYCGYQPAVREFKTLLSLNIDGFDTDSILKAYFSNDISLFKNFFDKILGEGEFEKRVLSAFYDSTEHGDNTALEQLIVEIVGKVNS